jgi:hypothetical protein
MEIIKREYTVYKFNELSEAAQDKAISTLAEINADDYWYESTLDEAKTLGLSIDSFDTDAHNIRGNFTIDAESVAKSIIEEHGKDRDTFKDATKYLAALTTLKNIHEIADMPDEDIDTEDIDQEFEYALLEDYLSLLRQELDYQTSREAIIETIEANEYQFTVDGKIFN